MILASFIFFLTVFFAIGMSAVLRNRRTIGDYYIASRSVSPLFVGLSAVATNNSGYMFIGIMGFTYVTGLSVFWLLFGWIAGDFLTSLYIHRNLRVESASKDELTFAGAIAHWGGRNFKIVRLMIALIALVFLSIYAASQLNAGGKALEALFGLPAATGAVLVAVMVAFYCMAGGIRASIWTDVAQSFVMLVSMGVLAITAVVVLGGLSATYTQLAAVPNYLDWFPYRDLAFAGSSFWFLGALLFVIGWMFSGFCVVGQPHVMIRFMAMRDVGEFNAARGWYYSFYILFGLLTVSVGLLTKVHLPDMSGLDPELVLPMMALNLLPGVLVGLMLAGVFAATMSTTDSLVLSCSSALTHDLLPRRFDTTFQVKLTTLGITLFSLGLAWYAQVYGGATVFTLTQFAWAGMGAAFGPILLLLALKQKMTEPQALSMMVSGIFVVIMYRVLELPTGMFYEGIAGISTAFIVWALFVHLPTNDTQTQLAASK